MRTIDVPIDIDLGELIAGQHIVLRGITLRTPWGSVLRYSFVPGFSDQPRTTDASWRLGKVNDDLGTVYDHQGQGGWGLTLMRSFAKVMRIWETAFLPQHRG
jgi:hypothetical protein